MYNFALINNKLCILQMDIVTLQETRLSLSGMLREKDYTFYWQGKSSDKRRERGIGFDVKNSLLGSIIPPADGTERILKLQLQTLAGPVSLISAYAPTLTSPSEAKDRFQNELSTVISNVPPQEPLFILGDFKARVAADHRSWTSCLGHNGIGKTNENGQRLLQLCCHHSLCITNTYFKTKPQQQASWRHHRSKHLHQLDLAVMRRSSLNSVQLTHSYQSADCNTDHSLMCCKAKLQSQRIHHSKRERKP